MRKLIWSEMIIITLESYLEMLISGYLNTLSPKYTTYGEIMGLWVSYYCLFISLVVIPMVYLWMSSLPFREILSTSFRKKWKSLYFSSDLKSKA